MGRKEGNTSVQINKIILSREVNTKMSFETIRKPQKRFVKEVLKLQ